MNSKRFNPKDADKLMSAERLEKLQPEKIIDSLDVGNEDSIADLGSGTGAFTIPLAKRTKNPVYAIDIEPEMLEQLNKNATAENLTNIKLLMSNLENINLPDESVSRVLNTFVIHEVDEINHTIEEMKRILTPGGIIVLADWEAVETESGPPLEIRIPSTKIEELLKESGFDTEIVYSGPEHYVVKAIKTDYY